MDYYGSMRLQHTLLPFILACSLGSQTQAAEAPELAAKSSALDGQLFYQLLLGELSARSEDPGASFSLFLDVARKTGDAVIFRRAVQIALQAHAGESALQAAKAWNQAIPASREANRFVLQILLGLNRVADSFEPLKRELALTPAKERRDMIWSIPALYERVNDRQLAALTVQKSLASQLSDPITGASAWASLGRLWLSAGDKTAALNAAAKGQAIDSGSEHVALLALSMMNPDEPQAERLVKKHLPNARPEFRMSYIKALLSVQREEDAKTQLQTIRSNAPDYADAWLIDGALALQAGQLKPAELQLQHYLDLVDVIPKDKQLPETKRGRSQAFFSLAQIALQRKNLQQAVVWLERIDNPDDVLRAQIRKAALIAQQGRIDEAIRLIQGQTTRSEADEQFKRSAEVQVLRDQKLFGRARDTLKTFIAQHPNDPDLVYDLAMVYEKIGDLVEMERLLRSLIAAKPKDPHAYNALGYSLAERNMRLPEAIQLINKALELSPKDPLITDSLGWAEFRSGHFDTALLLLQGAFKDKPDPEIAAHLGEVLWGMHRQQEAVEIFRQGLRLKPDNETLLETIQRLQIPL